MRKNKKIPKRMSVVATNSMRIGAIVVFFFVMVILNILSSSSYTQLQIAQGEMVSEIAKLEDAKTRELMRWAGMTKTEKIEEALFKNGLSMKPPSPMQSIRMLPNGQPCRLRTGCEQCAIIKAKLRDGEKYSKVERPASMRSSVRRKRSR